MPAGAGGGDGDGSGGRPVVVAATGDGAFAVTPGVAATLIDVCRALAAGAARLSVLLHGPTAVGKAPLVDFLARVTGHPLVRVNVRTHADMSEYLCAYVTDGAGWLAHRDGPVVAAARTGP